MNGGLMDRWALICEREIIMPTQPIFRGYWTLERAHYYCRLVLCAFSIAKRDTMWNFYGNAVTDAFLKGHYPRSFVIAENTSGEQGRTPNKLPLHFSPSDAPSNSPHLPSFISYPILSHLKAVLVKGSLTTPAISFEEDNTAVKASLLC